MDLFATLSFLGRAKCLRKTSFLVRVNLKPQITGDAATKDLLETSQKFISNYHFQMLRIHSYEPSPLFKFTEILF